MINTVWPGAPLVRACSCALLALSAGLAQANVATKSSTQPLAIAPPAALTSSAMDEVLQEKPVDPVTQIYAASKKTLMWSAYGQPKELAYEALEALQRAPEHGLDPRRYAIDTLYELIQNAQSEQQLIELDRLLTAAVWSFSEDLRIGSAHEKIRKRRERDEAEQARKTYADVDKKALTALTKAIVSEELRSHLDALPPTFTGYKELQSVLDTYTDFHLLGGWDELPADMFIKPGDSHPSMNALRYRLIMTDGLPPEATGSDLYDEQVEQAIVRFQTRHGLAADGEIGPATLKALNVAAAQKIESINLNLARLRQLPKELPEDHIAVNIPEFKLRMFRNAEEALTMGVVVGSRRTPTPAMQDKMRHLVFNPYWYPPHNITVQEILPKLRRDPSYLERTGFELLQGKTVVDAKTVKWKEMPARNFPFRLRQIPGEKNALGAVKFIFPNKKAIYLHDTPSRKLFAERVRAFSHGCIRLEKPTELATALMDWDRGWTEEEVLADITAAKRKLRKFKEKMPIYLLYQTAAIENGVVRFYPDIYGHDRSQTSLPKMAPLVAKTLTSGAHTANQRIATR